MKKKYFDPEIELTKLNLQENLLLGPEGELGTESDLFGDEGWD